MKNNDNLRSRRMGSEDCSGSSAMEFDDVEMNLSFEDFSERVIEDEEDDKKCRKRQRRSSLACAATFMGVCALLFLAASKTLNAAETSVNRRSNTAPVQRYQSIHATRRF